jgi:hypothetical protein
MQRTGFEVSSNRAATNGEVTMAKVKSITVIGKRWFNRGPGNTYFSANIIVDGKQVHRIEYAYGYGTQYAYEAFYWLAANGYLPGFEHTMAPWRYCEDHGITLYYEASDVSRKRDL